MEIVFSVTSGYGARTQEPYVQILIKAADWMAQMSPDEARDLAHNLLACAESAESDGFIVEFVREQLRGGLEHQAAILESFRAYREGRHHASAME